MIDDFEKYDKIVHRNGLTMVNWLFYFETKNYNTDLIKFTMKLKEFYPFFIKKHLLVGMKKSQYIFAKMMMSIYEKTVKSVHQDIKFISIEQLKTMIDSELIPIEMSGTRISTIKVQSNIQPLKNLGHFTFSERSLEIFYKYHESVLKKIDKTNKICNV